jgi:ABC-type bacteriocin/lantibiotic exporter with double-glycine peptidase domain
VLPLFSQELPTSCVAACVRMVLTGLGHPLTEVDIRDRCGQLTLGMRLNQVAKGLSDLPVAVAYELEWSLDDLVDAVRAGTNPVVGIDLRPVEGIFACHAVVIVGISDQHVLVHDPLGIGRVPVQLDSIRSRPRGIWQIGKLLSLRRNQ